MIKILFGLAQPDQVGRAVVFRIKKFDMYCTPYTGTTSAYVLYTIGGATIEAS